MLFFMMTYVIPRITKIFEESGKALPLMTIILIKISSFLSDNIVLLPILAAGVVFGLYRFKRTPRGRRFFDRFIIKLPVIGRLAKMVAISRFARTLSTVLASGIPLLEALEVAESVVGNTVFAKAIGNVRENIREGTSLAAPLRESGVFPPLVTRMVAVGEQTGELEEMLSKVADIYDLQVETSLSALTSLLEPVMILVMGIVVGFIVFAILLPIFDLTQVLS